MRVTYIQENKNIPASQFNKVTMEIKDIIEYLKKRLTERTKNYSNSQDNAYRDAINDLIALEKDNK